jgi:hypothetical protein
VHGRGGAWVGFGVRRSGLGGTGYGRRVQLWAVVRRVGHDRITTLATLVVVVLSMVLVATGPIYSEAVTVAALRQSLVDAPPRDSSITVEVATTGHDAQLLDGIVTSALDRATSATGAEVTRRAASGSYEYAAAGRDGLIGLMVFRALEGIDDRVSIVAGAWPAPGEPGIALDVRSAERLGLGVGTTVDLATRRDPAITRRVIVAAHYRIDDPADPFWDADPILIDGVTESASFRTWAVVAPLETVITATTPRVSLGWFARPDLGSAGFTDVVALRRRTAELERDLDVAVDLATGGAGREIAFEVDTGLPEALRDAERSLTVTRSSVLAITVQLAILAGYALVLAAGLTSETRRTELEVLRARGANPGQLVRRAVSEALVLTVPAVLVGPQLAAVLARALNQAGPLARNNLVIEPRPLGSAYLLTVAAGVVTVGLLAIPTSRLARTAQRAAEGRRDRPRSVFQRAGVDLALAVLAALAIWQLATLGEARAADIRGRFGVDPLLVAAPALGLFAGAFLALRVVPGVAGLAERSLPPSRSAVPALAGWEIARRPTRYARSALLLIIAVALGVFASTYETTWERSQVEQANHRVGADLAIEPDRREGVAIPDLHLREAYEELDGVRTAMPVTRRRGALPNSERPAELVALDAAVAGGVASPIPGGRTALLEALSPLVEGRPEMPAIAMPSDTVGLELDLTLDDPAPADVDEERVDYVVQVFLVVRDRHGLLHRLGAGQVAAGSGSLSVDLVADEPSGGFPSGPLGLVDVELRTTVPPDRSRTVVVEIAALDAVGASGARSALDAAGWSFASEVVGPLDERTSIVTADDPGSAVVAAAITTGRSRFGAVATYGIRPTGAAVPDTVPAIVDRSWFDANRREIGDVLALPGLADRTGRIVATIDAFATVDPGDADVVLVDLASLQAASYGLGQPIAAVDEIWLAIDGDPDAVAEGVRREPYEATTVVGRAEAADRLLSDPPAVGTIGVLTVGFVAAAVFAVVGFLLAATVSARERAGEFALVRALGLSARGLAAWTTVEQLALVGLGLCLGTSIGLVLAAVLVPAMSLTAGGGEVFPTVDVVYPWATIALVQIVVLAGLAVSVVGITAALRRLAVARQLRAGAQ